MKKTKRFAAILLAVCVLSMLAGCGGEKAKEYAKGTLTSTSFESEFIGLRFAVPEGFTMATEAEMVELADFGGELIYSDKEKKILDYAKANTVYEMMASNVSTGTNVMVMIEKIPLENMTIDEYIVELKKQMDSANMGYTYGDTSATKVVDQEYTMVPTSVEMMGVALKQDYLLRKEGNRIIAIAVTYTEAEVAAKDALLSEFKAY